MATKTQSLILSLLGDLRPRSAREISEQTGLSSTVVDSSIRRMWRRGQLFRTEVPIREYNRMFKGRAGIRTNMRNFHLYVLATEGKDTARMNNRLFVRFDEKYYVSESKAKIVLDFLKENMDKALYSMEVVEILKSRGVKTSDVMSNVRRFEKKGLVFVRGYRSGERETPFDEGFLLTFIDQGKKRSEAIEEAVRKTDEKLVERSATNPTIERVHRIRDQIIVATKMREIVGYEYLLNKLGCTDHELKYAIKRTLQLYPDLRMVKLFNAYPYFYHSSLDKAELEATVKLKENYIRKVGGRKARIGHNWEAVVGWFIDEFTDAEFLSQKHREGKTDPRRITVHLIRPTAGRRRNAEIDRVWRITPTIFSEPITYCLECKWGVVRKRDLDGFLSILKNSTEFGVETESGRSIQAGIIPVFAGGTFNPQEKVYLENGPISLIQYASRMNIQLLRASDFNQKLRERGCDKRVTVQAIYKRAKDEQEVGETLNAVWKEPERGKEILKKLAEKNSKLYEFERMLEEDEETAIVEV